MPCHRIKTHRQACHAGQHGKPAYHGQYGPKRSRKKERPEPVAEHRRPPIVSQRFHGSGHSCLLSGSQVFIGRAKELVMDPIHGNPRPRQVRNEIAQEWFWAT